jgi:hypothetical protein
MGELEKKWLTRNELQQTPFSEALIRRDEGEITSYLSLGSACSVFVHGYLPDSLICTLPQTVQPPSTVFRHPPPLKDTPTDIMHKIDVELETWIQALSETTAKAKEALRDMEVNKPIPTIDNFFPENFQVNLQSYRFYYLLILIS